MKKGFIPFETPSRELDKLSNTTLLCRKKSQTGFTLLEILLVVGIIAILAGIVIVALNPTKQFAQVRNTQRKANLSELNKALYQYYIDHSHYPTTLTTTLTEICATGASSTPTGIVCTGLVDLSALVPTYLVAIPADPQGSLSFLDSLIPTAYAITNGTGYLVALNSASKPYLEADNAELNQSATIGNINGVMPDRLAAYWSFDDAGAGTALDSAGTNNGSVSGPTATTGVKGLVSTAYNFDGASDYISLTGLAIGQNSSVSFWFKPSSTATSLIFSNSRSLVDSFTIFLGTGGKINLTNDNYDGVMSSTVFSSNQWYYVVFNIPNVNDSSTVKLYINGIDVTSFVHSQTFDPRTSTSLGNSSATYCYNGIIDNFRVYSKVLTLDEILNIYNTEKP